MKPKKIVQFAFGTAVLVLVTLFICLLPFTWGSPPPYYMATKVDSVLWNPNTPYGYTLLRVSTYYGWYEDLRPTVYGMETRGISFSTTLTGTDIAETPISWDVSLTYPLPGSDLFCLFYYQLGVTRFYCRISYPDPPPAGRYLFDFDNSTSE